MNAKLLYRVLLRLFPGDYRLTFAPEMLDAFEREAEQQHRRGGAAYRRFVRGELVHLALRVPVEWFAKATTSRSVRARSLPDLRMMRPAGVARSMWFAAAKTPGVPLPDEVEEAERRVECCLRRMEHAIATHDFPGARFYSDEDLKAREELRQLRVKHGLNN